MTEQPTEESFAGQLNTKFRIRAEAPRPVELELVEVKGFNAMPTDQRGMERFSLYFKGPEDIFVPQATYTLDHEKLGALDLFLVPIARDASGYRYEAVFNIFKKRDE